MTEQKKGPTEEDIDQFMHKEEVTSVFPGNALAGMFTYKNDLYRFYYNGEVDRLKDNVWKRMPWRMDECEN